MGNLDRYYELPAERPFRTDPGEHSFKADPDERSSRLIRMSTLSRPIRVGALSRPIRVSRANGCSIFRAVRHPRPRRGALPP